MTADKVAPDQGVRVEEIQVVADGADARGLAALHMAALPGSGITELGQPGATSFYRFAIASPLETVFAARLNDRLCGCAVLTREPKSLMRRFLFNTVARLDAPLILRALKRRLARPSAQATSVLSIVETPDRTISETEIAPELSLIFVDGTLRGAGIGVALLNGLETFLQEHGGVRTLFARTNARSDNRAIGFYDRHGFERIGRSGSPGKTLLVMRKTIAEAARADV